MIREGQKIHPRQQATQDRQSYKQRNSTQRGRQEQGYKTNITKIVLEVTYSVPGYKESCTSTFTEESRLTGVFGPSIACIVPAPLADSRKTDRIEAVDVTSG